MSNKGFMRFLICLFLLCIVSGQESGLPRCENQGLAPGFPFQHCGYDFEHACPGNSPHTRTSWCQCDICTDTETFFPFTGVTRKYHLAINATRGPGPDGYVPENLNNSRENITVNGQVPGPTIFADWGDEVINEVQNNLIKDPIGFHEASGVSIHWHGINQLYTNEDDGVPSLTQCPIPPGAIFTYRWKATQYGTAWYHSHIETQAWNGAFGGIVINGPASADYDEDRGVLFLNDWSHQTTEEYYALIATSGLETMANGLINGTNIWDNTQIVPANVRLQVDASPIGGYRFNMTVEHDKKYRIRLVNGAIDSNFEMHIEGHNFTVIAADLVPIVPYHVSSIHIMMGQRYDIILHADSNDPGPFWIIAKTVSDCGDIFNRDHVQGILYYGERNDEQPKDLNDHIYNHNCVDEKMDSLTPYMPKKVPWPIAWADISNSTQLSKAPVGKYFDSRVFDANVTGRETDSYMKWTLNNQSMHVHWEHPTLLDVIHNNLTNLSKAYNAVVLPRRGIWFYLLITNNQAKSTPEGRPIPAAAHPMHLHGHDFYVLSQSTDQWDGTVKTQNPIRRDTAMLDVAKGHILLAWKIDNPGVWLLHCHIGWHTAMGFDLQFIELPDEIPGLTNWTALSENCQAWESSDAVRQEGYDSGV